MRYPQQFPTVYEQPPWDRTGLDLNFFPSCSITRKALTEAYFSTEPSSFTSSFIFPLPCSASFFSCPANDSLTYEHRDLASTVPVFRRFHTALINPNNNDF